MPPLRRHQLVHLAPPGWRAVLDADWDRPSRACLAHWASHGLPLVVTRQPVPPGDRAPTTLALGLAAPACWERRALALQVPREHVAWVSEFPALAEVLPELPPASRETLQRLDGGLQQLGIRARAYGSAGWQQLTGLRYLHERSDLDLWLAVDGVAEADAAAHLLQHCAAPMRLDGELLFLDGSAVAWREWAAWRDGRCREVLVKRLHGATLEADPARLAQWWSAAA